MKYNNSNFVGFTVDTNLTQRERNEQDLIDLESSFVSESLSITDLAEQIVASEVVTVNLQDKNHLVSRQGFGPWS